ncbi:MAG TPA: CAP domain-containing protein [Acidimicrobiales bacterium]|nr:CAP domain-containing protein [Acidimicrobiales bacterium]
MRNFVKAITISGLIGAFALATAVPASAECEVAQGIQVCQNPPSEPTEPQPSSEPAPAPASQPSSSSPSAPASNFDAAAASARLLNKVNQSRAEAGLAPVAAHSGAAAIGAGHSANMLSKGTIFHNDSYFAPSTRKQLGASLLGENVAQNMSLDDAHVRLMNSPGHRANILNGRFNQLGIGVARGSDGYLFITEDFLQTAAVAAPAVAKARPAVAAAAVAPAPIAARSAAAASPVETPRVASDISPVVPDAVPTSPVTSGPRLTLASERSNQASSGLATLAIVLLLVTAGLVAARLHPAGITTSDFAALGTSWLRIAQASVSATLRTRSSGVKVLGNTLNSSATVASR